MNYKSLLRIFLILLVIFAVLITSIPFANHYDNSFTLNTKNNITEKYNGTTHYIIQGRYYSAFFRTYGGKLKLMPDTSIIENGQNYTINNCVSIYSVSLHYNNSTGHKIFEKNILNTVNVNLTAGYYMIKYNSTLTIYGRENSSQVNKLNLIVVDPPGNYAMMAIIYIFAIPTAATGILSGILYNKNKHK
ncbi:hypothetical protein ACLIKE_09845 [Ferroplasma acidiphilum]|uniref:Uncharacterized protein n=1 Tax=Ferroplasma acidiphilum TaxID=74969 RepID=A0A1V0N5V9_9ARCH|nr:hypothetical protein [Ferroplasma acidiphilum]ARD85513.1 hypothetical protein FAD_1669 [Ferroplasma acidiphilum]NOL59306.1 hypothetical protein [Ferroplasma acidiphilum]